MLSKIKGKGPLALILIIISVMISGLESVMFGFKTSYLYFVLGIVIIFFLIIYFKFYK